MSKESPFISLSYPICVRVHHGHLEVSQPDLGLYEGILRFDQLNTAQQLGDLILGLMTKVSKTITDMNASNLKVPPPSTPKELMNIPKYQFCTVKQASNYLGISCSSVRRLCESNKIQSKRTTGGHRKISLEDLQDFKKTY